MKYITSIILLSTGISAVTVGEQCPAPQDAYAISDCGANCAAANCMVDSVKENLGQYGDVLSTDITCGCQVKAGDVCPPPQGTYAIANCAGACAADKCLVSDAAPETDAYGNVLSTDVTCECKVDDVVLPTAGDQCPAPQDAYAIQNCGGDCDAAACLINDVQPTKDAYGAIIGADVTCGCKIVLPDVGAQCPAPESYYSLSNCGSECSAEECLIDSVAETKDAAGNVNGATITCACDVQYVTTDAPSSCEYPAYDNNNYCRCPEPRPSPEYPDKEEVSVCGDATYLLPQDVVPCSGPTGQAAAGEGCPKKGDTTTIACREEIISYLTGGSTGTCTAPEDAICTELNTGAWGCVFPGNCNIVNQCTQDPVCSDEYKQVNGTCEVADNGYTVPNDNYTGLVDTSALPQLTEYSEKSTLDPSTANSLGQSISILMISIASLLFL